MSILKKNYNKDETSCRLDEMPSILQNSIKKNLKQKFPSRSFKHVISKFLDSY